MQESFLSLLWADDELLTLVAKEPVENDDDEPRPFIDWLTRPDAGQYPAITLRTVSDIKDLNQEATTKLVATRVQFDFWGSDSEAHGGAYAQVRKMYRRVDKMFGAVDGHHPQFTSDGVLFKKVIYDNHRDMPITDGKGGERVFHLEADFIVWWRYAPS